MRVAENIGELLSEPDEVKFKHFVTLLSAISKVAPIRTYNVKDPKKKKKPACDKLKMWKEDYHKRYPNPPKGTTAIIFKLLFPEEDTDRKYHMKETKLGQVIAEALGMKKNTFDNWDAPGASGCLGLRVREVMQERSAEEPQDVLTLQQVDAFLTELAALSPYSAESIHKTHPTKHRKRMHIVRDVFRNLDPVCASFLVEIILKNLMPILYRVPAGTTPRQALLEYNSKSFYVLTKEDAMRAWDPRGPMLNNYKCQATLDETCRAWEDGRVASPTLNVPIMIPRSEKGQSSKHAVSCYGRTAPVDTLWAEIKYDGERAQIHLEYVEDDEPAITIFSKSQRNSTKDRTGVHHIAREAVFGPNSPQRVKRNVILDAEMVAYNDVERRIDEFWRIRELVDTTAEGVRSRQVHAEPVRGRTRDSDTSSLVSIADDDRHLAVVFFDVLYLDGESLLRRPYSERRRILESVIAVQEGYAMLSQRTPIDMTDPAQAEQELSYLCAKTYANYEEGLMLKADNGMYNQYFSPWVKMKRDYIPGVGDAVDVVLLGAGWNKKRATGLYVTTDVLTTIYLGVCTNSAAMKRDSNVKPHFDVYFTAEYGPAVQRKQLEDLNFWMHNTDHEKFDDLRTESQQRNFNYNFSLFDGIGEPRLMLKVPLVAEVYGAGFTVSRRFRRYELRFPRLTKVHRQDERSWTEAQTKQSLHEIARNACGRDPTAESYDLLAADLFNSDSEHPSVRSVSTIQSREESFWQILGCGKYSKKRALEDKETIKSHKRPTQACQDLQPKPWSPLPRTHSLPTPKTSPMKTTVKRLLKRPAKSEASLLSSRLADFAKTTLWTVCDGLASSTCRAWRRQMGKDGTDNLIHTVEGILEGCGWVGDAKAPWAMRGLLVVNSNNRETVTERLQNAASRDVPERLPIWLMDGDVTIKDNPRSQVLHIFQ